jgi:ankyrin repeat protein
MSESVRGLILSLLFLLSLPPTPSPNQQKESSPSAFRSETNGSLNEALHIAVRSGNLNEVNKLLASGVDVNARDGLGSTPLLDAAWSGNADMARVLLQHGADVNAAHREAGSTALEYAVLTGHTAVVKLLLAAGADTTRRYRYDQTVLHLAAARGFPQILESLVSSQAAINPVDANGNTPLDEAVLHNQMASIRFLISHGAEVKYTHATDGRGPVHEAAIKGFSSILPLLVDAGANPVRRDRSGQTPLDLALAYKNVNVVAALLNLGSRISESQAAADEAMETAVLKGQVEIVRILLDSGFEINKPTANGSTYLHDAALKNQKKVAELLLRCGARLDALNQTGGTPLHDAALGGSVDVINLLLDQGAKINATDEESGATPLMLAASLDRSSAVAVLLKRGADPALKDRHGMTALERAKKTEDPETVKLLEVR